MNGTDGTGFGELLPCGNSCPCCGEMIELLVEPSAGAQEYIEDCEVCCQPMVVRLRIEPGGAVLVELLHQDH